MMEHFDRYHEEMEKANLIIKTAKARLIKQLSGRKTTLIIDNTSIKVEIVSFLFSPEVVTVELLEDLKTIQSRPRKAGDILRLYFDRIQFAKESE